MLIYYFVTFGISLLFTLLYVLIWHKHFDVHFTLMFSFIPIANLGALMRAVSTNLNEAIVANDIIYLGSTFLMLFMMMCILDRCNITLPKPVRIGFFIFSMIVFAGALTSGWAPLFYTSLSMTKKYGVTILVKEYGFMHTLFYVMIILYMLISIGAMIYSFRRKKDVSNKIILLMDEEHRIYLL